MSIAPPAASPAATHVAAPRPPASGNAQQLAQVNQLVSKYKGDIARHATSQVLSSLARQIVAAERNVGQHFVLPSAPSAQAPAKSVASVPEVAGAKVNVTA